MKRKKDTIVFLGLIIFMFSIFLISCDNKEKEELELTILNDSISCVNNLNYEKIYFGNKRYDKLYDSLSTSVIKYKLHNNTNKKYFIVFNSNFLNNYDELFYNSKDTISNKLQSVNSISFSLYSNYNVKGEYSNYYNANPFLNATNFFNYIMQSDSLSLYRFKKSMNIKNTYSSRNLNEIITNGFVLYPNETKYFSSIINLPLRDYKLGIPCWNTLLEKNRNYRCGLTVYNSEKEIKQFLSPDLKKEIEENGYIIFNGVIQSNKIPVKLISLPSIH